MPIINPSFADRPAPGLKRCPTCKKEVAHGARTCPHCGKTFTTAGGVFIAVIVALILGAIIFGAH